MEKKRREYYEEPGYQESSGLYRIYLWILFGFSSWQHHSSPDLIWFEICKLTGRPCLSRNR